MPADLTVGAGFDTGTQGAILSIGTNDNLIDRTRIGGKDVSAKGESPPRSAPAGACSRAPARFALASGIELACCSSLRASNTSNAVLEPQQALLSGSGHH